jgi:phosphoenolpyruvate phosphomutase
MSTTTASRDKPAALRSLLEGADICRAVGVGDGLSAMLAEKHGFEAIWASGLSISAAHGLPDASILTMTEFLGAASMIDAATRLPIIADCDTGFGDVNVVMRMTREYERAGIAAVCIEDKQFPKRNSFTAHQELAPIDEFAMKIRAVKRSQIDPDFAVIARIESLIAGTGLDDALERGERYCEAGADAILIHSKATTAAEVLEFAEVWEQRGNPIPLVAVPTTYYGVSSHALADAGFAMVIYANHPLRAAVRAIDSVLQRISCGDSTEPIEQDLTPVKEVLTLIGMDAIAQTEAELAAGDPAK